MWLSVLKSGLTDPWALNKYDCLFLFDVINWPNLSNNVRK